MTGTIKAIETKYKGCRFRSRLEARWAVLFDALGIKWEYEKEGFDLGEDVRYLPDFWLPEKKLWVEVKGEQTSNFCDKAFSLHQKTGFDVVVVKDIAPPGEDTEFILYSKDRSAFEFTTTIGFYDWNKKTGDNSLDVVCPMCGGEYTHIQKAMFNPKFGCQGLAEIAFDCEEGCRFSLLFRGDKGKVTASIEGTKRYSCFPLWLSKKLAFAEEAVSKARSARFEHGETPK